MSKKAVKSGTHISDIIGHIDQVKEAPRFGIPGFVETLIDMQKVHISKNEDYSAVSDNRFYNFDFTEMIIRELPNPKDQVFIWPIANKIGRLAMLLRSLKAANNESIEDSLIDIANYIILWKCDIQRRKNRVE